MLRLGVFLLFVASACCNDLDFKVPLAFEAYDSAMGKEQMNRLVLALVRRAAMSPKDVQAIDECYDAGNKDIIQMKKCYNEKVGILVNGVCDKAGITKFVHERLGHGHAFAIQVGEEAVGCFCLEKAEEMFQCTSSAAFRVLHKACGMIPKPADEL